VMSLHDIESDLARDHVDDAFSQEVGTSLHPSIYDGMVDDDYNPDLRGTLKIKQYDEMRRSDGAVRTAMRIVKAPLLAAEWYVERGDDSEVARDAAEFVWQALNGMSRMFPQIITETLLMLDYGYYPFFKVFKPAQFTATRKGAHTRDVVTWKKWGPRHPMNTVKWKFDEHGGVQGLIQNKSPDSLQEVPMRIRDLLIFTLDEEGGNPEGLSLLRSAYPHWYWRQNLYRIDAIQKERHGIGIPYVELPPNATTDDRKFAKLLVENLRTNEKAGFVKPFGWDVGFLEVRGQQVDALASAQHHGVMILMNVLAQFVALGTQESGSRAVGNVQEDIFVKSTHYLADLVRGVINKWAIPQLVDYNFNGAPHPELKVRRIGDTADLRALSVTLRNYCEVGLITPTPEFEKFLRRYHDFPAEQEVIEGRGVDVRTERKPGDTSNRVPKPTE
jgi:hypothetical protein